MAEKNEGERLPFAFAYVSASVVSRRYPLFRRGAFVHNLAVFYNNDNNNQGDFGLYNVVFVAVDSL